MDLDSFSDDTPDDDAPPTATVCAVATQRETFDRCRAGFYPAPRSYDRTRRSFDYMAFYRTAPNSAITHYAPVTDRVEQTRGQPGPMDETDWAELIEPFSDEQVVVVFQLGELVPLTEPVGNDENGVRGAWYCRIEDLRAASSVSELAARADT